MARSLPSTSRETVEYHVEYGAYGLTPDWSCLQPGISHSAIAYWVLIISALHAKEAACEGPPPRAVASRTPGGFTGVARWSLSRVSVLRSGLVVVARAEKREKPARQTRQQSYYRQKEADDGYGNTDKTHQGPT